MWSGRTIAALFALAAGCAPLQTVENSLEKRVGAVLEQRKLGADALRVVDNVLRHGPPAPRAVPPVVLELLARPLDAADAASLFRRAVPPLLTDLQPEAAVPFDNLLQTYVGELAEAQRLLRAAVKPFDEEALLRQLSEALPTSSQMLAVADAVDPAQLEQANRLFIEATVRFARRLGKDLPEGKTFDLPMLRIIIGTRGNDVYQLSPARGGRASVIIDPGGDDEYRGSDLALNGFSAIIDLAGNDRYLMNGPGLGAAIAGASLLLDFAGDDSYQAKFFAQGAAAFGFGALIDFAGNDRYRIEAWGQGFGLGGGTGLLWDRAGEDRYTAGGVPDPFNRAGGLSGAQGAGFGYRGRLGGGIGILRDDAGDDVYEAQMFAQGLGYYYALGLLWDRGGNDQYRAAQYAQGSGVHQAVGVLRDESGDDRYEIAAIYGQGMGLDVAVGVLVDLGGNDSYRAREFAQGAASANGFGLLADLDGNDRYELATVYGWGHAQWLRGLPSVGVLLNSEKARNLPVEVQPATRIACPAEDPGEAIVCRVREASDLESTWRELQALLIKEPSLAGWIAIALRERPPPAAQADEIAALLAARESCNVRALGLRAWPTLAAAQAGIRSDCFRLQAAARAAFARLGQPLPADAPLPSFLRSLPPQEDTF